MGTKIFDQFTYLHFGVGIITYFWGITIYTWIIIHTLFEIIENTEWGIYVINNIIKVWPGGKPQSDDLINSIGDTIGALLGWGSAYYVDLDRISTCCDINKDIL